LKIFFIVPLFTRSINSSCSSVQGDFQLFKYHRKMDFLSMYCLGQVDEKFSLSSGLLNKCSDISLFTFCDKHSHVEKNLQCRNVTERVIFNTFCPYFFIVASILFAT